VSSRESRVTGHVGRGSKSVTHCHLWSTKTLRIRDEGVAAWRGDICGTGPCIAVEQKFSTD